MCEICELQFAVAAPNFDEWLCSRSQEEPAASTPGQRVHNRAVMLAAAGETFFGTWINAWYLAMAVERLLALESAGIST